jgi:hypothetical protein
MEGLDEMNINDKVSEEVAGLIRKGVREKNFVFSPSVTPSVDGGFPQFCGLILHRRLRFHLRDRIGTEGNIEGSFS